MRILVTGGAGFIGSNFIRHILGSPGNEVVNLDKLTYAGNLENLKDVPKDKRYRFARGDVCDRRAVEKAMRGADAVVHFAAETHVDRSIEDAGDFVKTDVMGTYVMLEAARKLAVRKFVFIGTDEVYGSIEKGSFTEEDRLNPRNPYSASKAGADLLAMSYFVTYGLPVVVTRSSNNFGPYQHREKLIPRFITNAIRNERLPLYGDGRNVRDWLYVMDNCSGIETVMQKGKPGEIYNIAGGNERANIDITKLILKELGKPVSLIEYVKDRPGHDRRYALDARKVRKLGWKPKASFEEQLAQTVRWYRDNEWWWGMS